MRLAAERMAEFTELQDQGDAKKERLEIEGQRLQRALDMLKEALTCPSAHPYIHEVQEIVEGWLTQSERLGNQRTLPTTFGQNRRLTRERTCAAIVYFVLTTVNV
jgi:hypothetical protein